MPLTLLTATPLGASMNVHSIVGHRALNYFSGFANGTAGLPPAHTAAYQSVIQEFLDALLAGSDFPDFLYACGSYPTHHAAGEAAHWPPFHAAAVRYLTGLQPDPTKWTADQRQLASFIFGVATHYVADELWEGLTSQLGATRGFTEMVDAFQLGNDGHGNTAEDVSNYGGGFYASWILDESNISAWRRTFPVKHIVNIYHETPKDGVFAPNATNFTEVRCMLACPHAATLTWQVYPLHLNRCLCHSLVLAGDAALAARVRRHLRPRPVGAAGGCTPHLATWFHPTSLGPRPHIPPPWALQSFGPLLYDVYNDGKLHQLPFITEELFDTPLAGIDDMATVVSRAPGGLI